MSMCSMGRLSSSALVGNFALIAVSVLGVALLMGEGLTKIVGCHWHWQAAFCRGCTSVSNPTDKAEKHTI